MFATFKVVKNNLNETKYIANKDELIFKNLIEKDSNNKVEIVSENNVRRELDQLQTEIRHNNLKLFMKNLVKARLKQFFIYTAPALMVAGNLYAYGLGGDTKHETLDAYKVTKTVLTDEGSLVIESDDKYYYTLIEREFVDEKDHNTSSYMDDLDLWLFSEGASVHGDFSIDSDVKITVDSADVDSYTDINEYDMTNAQELSERQSRFIKDILLKLSETSYLNGNEREKVRELIESDTIDYLAIYKDYEALGEMDVETKKSGGGRIIFSVITAAYIGFLIWLRCSCGPWVSRELTNDDGKLEESYNDEDLGIIYLAMKYKEIFKKAEEDRIKRIKTLGYKYFNAYEFDKTLTKFEKKIN